MNVNVTYKWERMPWLTGPLNSGAMLSALEDAAREVAETYYHTYEWDIKTPSGGWPEEHTVLLMVFDRKPKDDDSGDPEFHRHL